MTGSKLLPLLGLCASCWLLERPRAQEKEAARATEFVRLARDDAGRPTALQTAVVRYRPGGGEGELAVDLVSVVHMADGEYFKRLDRSFARYDVVLYELVADDRNKVPVRRPNVSLDPLAALQRMGRAFLGLESQLEHIDYTRENFVHADLSPRGMLQAARKRGDDGFTLFLGIAADLLREYNRQEAKPRRLPKGLEDPLSLFLDGDGRRLRRTLAEQLAQSAASGQGLGRTLNTLLISDRNAAAMKVFRRELAKGRKKIAIFYGAAHMPDFERRLAADYGLVKDRATWMTAWDLTGKKASGLSGLLETLTKPRKSPRPRRRRARL